MSAGPVLRTLIADDHAPTRDDVCRALEADPRFVVCAVAGDATWGETTWGGWDSDPTENPAMCLGGDPAVTDLVDDVYGDEVWGDVTEGAITADAVQSGDVTPSGAATLYVNGVALPSV